MHMGRSGLTLFEVAITLAIVVTAFVTVIAAIPAGMRQQEQARFKMYASAKMLELMTVFNTMPPRDNSMPFQQKDPWDVSLAYRPEVHDLEQLGVGSLGLAPLPQSIAQRLDSTNDEIQRILADGGKIYYATARPASGYSDSATVPMPPGEASRMLVAFVGFPQANQIPTNPVRTWPVYATYPSPPQRPFGSTESDEGQSANRKFNPYLYENNDPDLLAVMSTRNMTPASTAPLPRQNLSLSSVLGNSGDAGWGWYSNTLYYFNELTQDRALRYVALALWYADRKNLDPTFKSGAVLASDADVVSLLNSNLANLGPQISAARILGHSGMVLTRWYSLSQLTTGVVIPQLTFPAGTFAGQTTPLRTITWTMIQNWHENSLALAMAYAARYPYDWSAPRPINRAIMTDVPLMQWDLFGPTYSGNIQWSGNVAAGTIAAKQWKVLVPQMPLSPDCPNQSSANIAAMMTADPSRFNLTTQFSPTERCRQVVFWIADWQSYEDFESAPSHPVDASRYPLGLGDPNMGQSWDSNRASRMFFDQVVHNEGRITAVRPGYRNPEKEWLWVNTPPTVQRGQSTWAESYVFGDDIQQRYRVRDSNFLDYYPDRGITGLGTGDASKDPPTGYGDRRAVFSGLFGADRNQNRMFDRGNRPASVRLRATTVARFTVYDPRLPMVLR